MSIEGVRFADAWRERVATDFDGVPGQVIGRKHLITNKRAVGRPQDLMDVTNLLESERVGEKPLQDGERGHRGRGRGRRRGCAAVRRSVALARGRIGHPIRVRRAARDRADARWNLEA